MDFLNRLFDNNLRGIYVCSSDGWSPILGGSVDSLHHKDGHYFCPARLKGLKDGRRIAEMVERVHAVVVDDVGTKIAWADVFQTDVPQPSWVIETSKGNFQVGWACREGWGLMGWTAWRSRLRWVSDGPDAVHWFRLPSGMNPKNGFRTRLVSTGPVYAKAAELSALATGAPAVVTPGVMGHDVEAPAWMVEAVLGLMPNDDAAGYDYDAWIAIGHAVKAACGEAGREPWKDWSSLQPQGVDLDDKWDSFDPRSSSGFRKLEREAVARSGLGKVAGAVFDDGYLEPAEAEAPAAGLPRSKQLDYATYITSMHGGRLRFNLDRRAWHEFDGVIWRPCTAGVQRAAELSQAISLLAPPKGRGEADNTVLSFHRGVEGLCRDRPALQALEKDFDADPWLLGTPGGVVDLRTGVLRAAVAGDMISKSTAVAPAAVEDCPRWKRFVGEVTQGDIESAVFLQQYAGYCLTGVTTEQMLLFLWGSGGNGKSVFCDTLAGVLGDYHVKPAADVFIKKAHGMGHRSVLAALAGARLCTISEVPHGASWDETLIKDVTGGGSITANFMHQNPFTFSPAFKLLAYGNHQPSFPGGIDDAIKRRFRMMEFLFRPKVADKGLMKGLEKEWGGILRWAIVGGLSWAKVGFMLPDRVEKATDRFFDEQDLFGQWAGACIAKASGSKAKASDLFRSWTEWRNAQGDHASLDNATAFGRALIEKLGLKRRKSMGLAVYEDIKILSRAPDAFDDINEG